jgi:hypothetical protein
MIIPGARSAAMLRAVSRVFRAAITPAVIPATRGRNDRTMRILSQKISGPAISRGIFRYRRIDNMHAVISDTETTRHLYCHCARKKPPTVEIALWKHDEIAAVKLVFQEIFGPDAKFAVTCEAQHGKLRYALTVSDTRAV